jgi:hypothetical protein
MLTDLLNCLNVKRFTDVYRCREVEVLYIWKLLEAVSTIYHVHADKFSLSFDISFLRKFSLKFIFRGKKISECCCIKINWWNSCKAVKKIASRLACVIHQQDSNGSLLWYRETLDGWSQSFSLNTVFLHRSILNCTCAQGLIISVFWYRFDAGPDLDPNFHGDADPDPTRIRIGTKTMPISCGSYPKFYTCWKIRNFFFYFSSQHCQLTMFIFLISVKCVIIFKYFGQHI